jgi:hypothetical protein
MGKCEFKKEGRQKWKGVNKKEFNRDKFRKRRWREKKGSQNIIEIERVIEKM